jgi:hypothetical protein
MQAIHGSTIRPAALLAGTGLLCGLAATAALAGFDERRTVAGDRLVLQNLIGQVEIESHAGPGFEVEFRVRGADATPERVKIETREGGTSELKVRFPLEETRRYVYPQLGRGSRITLNTEEGSWLSQVLGRDQRIEVRGYGDGLEIWVDVTVKVPRDAALELTHGVGDVRARDLRGELSLDTGAGAVDVAGVEGRVAVDTGSGSVRVADVSGELGVDTGSGNVELARCKGSRISVDTGSGNVELDTVDAGQLEVDTGSGSVQGKAIGADDLRADTGSGGVRLDFARMGDGEFDVDTGSGGIALELPAGASAAVSASTGSGGIDIDIDDYDARSVSEDSAEFRIGGGAARLRLDTGSGGIRITQR